MVALFMGSIQRVKAHLCQPRVRIINHLGDEVMKVYRV
jgi:hypothetical protein